MDKFLPDALPASDRARIETALAHSTIHLLRATPDDWRDLFVQSNWPQDTALICDANTWKAMGEALAQTLSGAGFRVTLLNLGSNPKPDAQHLEYIRNSANNVQAIIGVGSGTMSDLAKMASFQLRLPYAICGTAASMNGYLSANASITEAGVKKTLPAHLPRLALFDLSVIEASPQRLTAAGFGDALCRSTAEADWRLSHVLLGTHFDSLPFDLLRPHEPALLAGDVSALVQSLLLSGLGMTLAGGSYPASQAEHLVAHYVDMLHPDLAKKHYHGEHIAVTTLLVAEIQQRLLQSTPALPMLVTKEQLLAQFGPDLAEALWPEFHVKQQRTQQIDLAKWQEAVIAIQPITVPAQQLREALRKVGAPTTPDAVGWNDALVKSALGGAKFLRNRFTFLDLA